MIRLFHEEYWNIKYPMKYHFLDEMLERTFDNSIFTKYLSFTNLMTANLRKKQCEKRVMNLEQEDLDIMNYIKFLVDRNDSLTVEIGHLKCQVEVMHNKNNK